MGRWRHTSYESCTAHSWEARLRSLAYLVEDAFQNGCPIRPLLHLLSKAHPLPPSLSPQVDHLAGALQKREQAMRKALSQCPPASAGQVVSEDRRHGTDPLRGKLNDVPEHPMPR
eukprot:scaffold241_cov242-Pinguiococcus_pyrenoidosus.AAC.17